MPAVAIVAAVASAVVGVGGLVVQKQQADAAERQAREQKQAIKSQEEQAKEAAALADAREDTGAKVKLGAQPVKPGAQAAAQKATKAGGRKSVGNAVGGLEPGASRRLGL